MGFIVDAGKIPTLTNLTIICYFQKSIGGEHMIREPPIKKIVATRQREDVGKTKNSLSPI